MRLFCSEVGQHYGTYTFAYAQYAEREAGDTLSEIYRQGYLPYSGSPDVSEVFYLARSARINLAGLNLTSENRRIAKKFDGQFTKERVPLVDFVADDGFYTFCLDYFAARHGAEAMPRERLAHILACGILTHVITYRMGNAPVAYVLEASDDTMGHYWFSFYDLAYARQSLGLWLMQDAVRDAAERGLTHYYLGTVYGQKALYKTNFEPLEWFDGERWSDDIAQLKARGRQDGARELALSDIWKESLRTF